MKKLSKHKAVRRIQTALTAQSKNERSTDALVVVAALQKQANPLFNQIKKIEINTKEDYEKAASLIVKLDNLDIQAEEQRKTMTVPLNTALKAINAHFKPFSDAVSSTREATKKEMLAFINRQEMKAVQVTKDFESGKIKKMGTAIKKSNELLDVSSEHASVRKVWQLRIVNEKKIPREYLVPDEVAIKAALKDGKDVPGCVLEQVKQIAI